MEAFTKDGSARITAEIYTDILRGMFKQLIDKVDTTVKIAKLPNINGVTKDQPLIDEEVDRSFKKELSELVKSLQDIIGPQLLAIPTREACQQEDETTCFDIQLSQPQETPTPQSQTAEDTEIDDPELLGKKHLTSTHTPNSIINDLKNKYSKRYPDMFKEDFQTPMVQKQSWHHVKLIFMSGLHITECLDINKTQARHTSAQQMLKYLFPGMTWNEMLAEFMHSKDPLNNILKSLSL
ncbi:hypothetical protein FGO68_gene11941 [Halteria grandinella]|uniref:Uncharacterized protein n=1 Tax=Halteria grandinella TaxID=5974 RepID=A0A8J8NCH3_HALGN|nr:hypothetical protein FGO68_gene11941 [Halteria grandinella]